MPARQIGQLRVPYGPGMCSLPWRRQAPAEHPSRSVEDVRLATDFEQKIDADCIGIEPNSGTMLGWSDPTHLVVTAGTNQVDYCCQLPTARAASLLPPKELQDLIDDRQLGRTQSEGMSTQPTAAPSEAPDIGTGTTIVTSFFYVMFLVRTWSAWTRNRAS